MTARQDGLSAEVFPAQSEPVETGERVRAGQVWRFGYWAIFTTYVKIGPFWMGQLREGQATSLELLPESGIRLGTLEGEDVAIAKVYADAGMMR